MYRRYNRWHLRFDQPDPYDGSYDLGDPQSFNRYAYTNNDPVNFTDPSGLLAGVFQYSYGADNGIAAFGGWGGGFNFNDRPSAGRGIIADRFNYEFRETEARWSFVTTLKDDEGNDQMGIVYYTDLIRTRMGLIYLNNGLDLYHLTLSPDSQECHGRTGASGPSVSTQQHTPRVGSAGPAILVRNL